MPVTYTKGNIFNSNADALVNPVNCLGQSGKGLALVFKKRFPKSEQVYKAACAKKQLKPGVLVTAIDELNGKPVIIVYFPTKIDWRKPSQSSYVRDGMKTLRALLLENGSIKSIAICALGCGLGGLSWTVIKPMYEQYFGDLKIEVLAFEP